MRKISVISLLFILTLFTNMLFCAEENKNIQSKEESDANKIISDIKAKAATIETFKADVLIEEEENTGEKRLIKIEVIFKKPNKSNAKLLKVSTAGKGDEQIIIVDGENFCVYMPAQKVVTKSRVTQTLKNLPPSPWSAIIDPFANLEISSVIYKGIEKINSKEVYLFEGRAKELDMHKEKPLIQLLFDVSNNLLHKKIVNYDILKRKASSTYIIKLNIPVSDKDFTLNLPSDVKVQEMSQ